MNTIYDRLKEYSESDYYGFHMPGHKRNKAVMDEDIPCHLDITEIEGFDDLHHADGIISEAQKSAAEVFGAEETHFLINGSTVGILSAIAGVTKKGDTVLVARNCHKSVYHAIYLNELKPVFVYPRFDEETGLNTQIDVEEVREALAANPLIRAAVIVSPTYDGVASDVEAIGEAVHKRGIPLIVDEAHGAHFGFHPYFPQNANSKGADIVICSLHKTLPSLTQTALLHMNGTLVNRERVRKYLHMLQSSSPSYILMAGIDSCIHLLREKGKMLFESYVALLKETREALGHMKRLRLVSTMHDDLSKLVISVANADITGRELYEMLLGTYHLQMEMMAGSYVLAMTSLGDTKEGMGRLINALCEIDDTLDIQMKDAGESAGVSSEQRVTGKLPRLEMAYPDFVMEEMAEEAVSGTTVNGAVRSMTWEQSAGYVSVEYAYLYPPGSPLVVPGERISKEASNMLQWYKEHNFSVQGPKKDGQIEVWDSHRIKVQY